MKFRGFGNLLYTATLVVTGIGTAQAEDLASLQGSWIMVAAYEIHADGTRTTNYGEHPDGRFMVDAAGHYSMQVFRVGRPAFASGDRASGTPEEYRAALLGISTHIGRVTIDATHHQLIFEVEACSFPNWEGKRQVRDYTFKDGVLSYAVPAYGGGTTAYSIWRRAPD
jgi:hypothetical protein